MASNSILLCGGFGYLDIVTPYPILSDGMVTFGRSSTN